MRNFKLVGISIYILLFTATTLFQSCSDSCEGVTCEYDGECDNGDCICLDLTKVYLIGTWNNLSNGSKIGTFNKDNTFTDHFGNIVTWVLDSSTNEILISTGNKIVVKKEGFSCSQMSVTIKSGTSSSNFIFIRQ